MADESEEKTLPASQKKLTDARRKGQTYNSKDLVQGFTLLAAVLYLVYRWPDMRDRLIQLIDVVSAATEQPSTEAWQRAVYSTIDVMVSTAVPLLVVVFVVAVVMGMAATQGPIFSFESVSLKFDNISPMKGAKRIFSMKNVIEFMKSLAKVVVLTATFWSVLRGFIGPLFQTPSCGDCLGQMVVSTLQPLAITAVIAFVIIGVLDLPLQRHLFMKEMRMSKTEKKREMKDLEGNPQIKSERRRLQMMFASRPPVRKGVRHAALVVAHEDRGVGLRYDRDEAPVPLIVSKGRAAAGDDMLAEARRLGIPVVEDATLVDQLIGKSIGDRIPPDTYTSVARLLVRYGV
jgi:type III secretion protein U